MKKEDYKLDNPVWHSLSETHQNFSIDYGGIKFYDPRYCPFGGFDTTKNISHQIDEYAALAGNFYVVGSMPQISNQLEIKKELVCLQMIVESKVPAEIKESIIALTPEHGEALFQLINLVQPGYFREQTGFLGNYYGIFKNGQLVAVTGERMKMNDYVEVSGIVTHPDHTGQGYAKQLITHAVNNIFHQGNTPFLHVVETNAGAIKLYEKLGFTVRRKISFWNIAK